MYFHCVLCDFISGPNLLRIANFNCQMVYKSSRAWTTLKTCSNQGGTLLFLVARWWIEQTGNLCNITSDGSANGWHLEFVPLADCPETCCFEHTSQWHWVWIIIPGFKSSTKNSFSVKWCVLYYFGLTFYFVSSFDCDKLMHNKSHWKINFNKLNTNLIKGNTYLIIYF